MAPDNLSTAIQRNIDLDFPQLVEYLRRVIAFHSVPETPVPEHPFGRNLTDCLNDFLRTGEEMGFACKNINNMVGYIEMGEGGPLYGIMCHLDVVPEGDSSLWRHSPFQGVVEDNRLYGRGSIDDKGPAVAVLFAMKALKDSGISLRCRFRLIVGLDEESGLSRCMEEYKKHAELPRYSFSPDANFPLINAEKGIIRCHIHRKFSPSLVNENLPYLTEIKGGTRINMVPDAATAVIKGKSPELFRMLQHKGRFFTWKGDGDCLTITGKGVSAHAMQPQEGRNAIVMLLSLLSSISYTPNEISAYLSELLKYFNNDLSGKLLGIACSDNISGALTCNMAIMELSPEKCTVSLDIRYPVTASGSDIISRLQKVASKVFGGEFILEQHTLPLHIPEENPFIQVLLKAYENVTGDKGYTASTGGGTYCRHMPDSVSFGAVFPGEEEMAHKTDEYVDLDSLKKATCIYAEALSLINDATEKL